MSGPLSGLRVIEVCGELGQLAGKLVADMGADVIKVEPPEGASARRVGPFVDDKPGPNRSLNFWYHNTNKRSVVLDLGADAGRTALRTLVAGADVLIEDGAPGELAALDLDPRALAASNPRLIACSITPFGQDGPWASYRTNDLVSLALGGPMAMNGYSAEDLPGAPPIHGNGDQAYNTACHQAVHGILAALLYRDRTGEGQYIDASAHEALSCTVEVGMPYWLYMKVDVIRQTGRHAAAQATEPWIHPTADGKQILVFGVGRDNATWHRMKAWMQEAGFGTQFDDERFNDPIARQPAAGRPEAKEIMSELHGFIGATPAEEVYRGAQELGLPWGTVRAPEENIDDPHWRDRGFWATTSGEDREQGVEMPGAPYIFSATPWELRRPAPKLGEYTDEVLAELRLSGASIVGGCGWGITRS